jgi:hypothetical protein
MAEYEKRIRAEGRAAAEKAVAAAQPNEPGKFFASLLSFVLLSPNTYLRTLSM